MYKKSLKKSLLASACTVAVLCTDSYEAIAGGAPPDLLIVDPLVDIGVTGNLAGVPYYLSQILNNQGQPQFTSPNDALKYGNPSIQLYVDKPVTIRSLDVNGQSNAQINVSSASTNPVTTVRNLIPNLGFLANISSIGDYNNYQLQIQNIMESIGINSSGSIISNSPLYSINGLQSTAIANDISNILSNYSIILSSASPFMYTTQLKALLGSLYNDLGNLTSTQFNSLNQPVANTVILGSIIDSQIGSSGDLLGQKLSLSVRGGNTLTLSGDNYWTSSPTTIVIRVELA